MSVISISWNIIGITNEIENNENPKPPKGYLKMQYMKGQPMNKKEAVSKVRQPLFFCIIYMKKVI